MLPSSKTLVLLSYAIYATVCFMYDEDCAWRMVRMYAKSGKPRRAKRLQTDADMSNIGGWQLASKSVDLLIAGSRRDNKLAMYCSFVAQRKGQHEFCRV